VLLLLAGAGLMRPEAWLLAGLYFLWIAVPAPWPQRLRYALLAVLFRLTGKRGVASLNTFYFIVIFLLSNVVLSRPIFFPIVLSSASCSFIMRHLPSRLIVALGPRRGLLVLC